MISLSESAAKHVSNFLTKRGKGIGVRLGVKTSGCSGMAYKLEFADAAEPEDIVFESQGLKVLVDPKSLPYLDGTELDYTKEGLNEGFKFNNPNVKDECGCGASFKVLWPSFRLPITTSPCLDCLPPSRWMRPGWTSVIARFRRAFILTATPICLMPSSVWRCNGPRRSTRPIRR